MEKREILWRLSLDFCRDPYYSVDSPKGRSSPSNSKHDLSHKGGVNHVRVE